MKNHLINLILVLLLSSSGFCQDFIIHSENPFNIQISPLGDAQFNLKTIFADWDFDGDLDIFYVGTKILDSPNLNLGSFIYSLSFQENLGSATNPNFGEKTTWDEYINYPVGMFFPSFGDIDNDAHLEIFATAGFNGFAKFQQPFLYWNNGVDYITPDFDSVSSEILLLGPFLPKSLLFPEFTDLDADGDLDILVSGVEPIDLSYTNSYGVSYYAKNIGTIANPEYYGWFDNPYDIKKDSLYEVMKVGDIDLDGDMDILSLISIDSFSYFYYKENEPLENGKPRFLDPVESPFGLPLPLPNEVWFDHNLADLDGDGDLDFLVVFSDLEGNAIVKFYENISCVPTNSAIEINLCAGEEYVIGETIYASSGEYETAVTNEAGCDSLISLSLHIKSFDLELSNEDGNLSVTPDQGSYQWFNCNSGNIQGAVGSDFAPEESGSYAVSIIDENGCKGISDCITIVINSTVEIEQQKQILLLPNPTKSQFEIINHSETSIKGLVIYKYNGEIVLTQNGFLDDPVEIDGLSSGIYFVEILLEKSKVIKKLVKYND